MHFLFGMSVVYRPHPLRWTVLMRLRMLKRSVGKGRQVIKQLRVLQYYATERAGYVLYRVLVMFLYWCTWHIGDIWWRMSDYVQPNIFVLAYSPPTRYLWAWLRAHRNVTTVTRLARILGLCVWYLKYVLVWSGLGAVSFTFSSCLILNYSIMCSVVPRALTGFLLQHKVTESGFTYQLNTCISREAISILKLTIILKLIIY